MEKLYILLEDTIDGKIVIASYSLKEEASEHASQLREIYYAQQQKHQVELNRQWWIMDRYSIEEISIGDIVELNK